ncbi:MAG: TonB-dependent receptor [Burkholderiales bacterium]|nr:TonB-dependent receptor [Burkholderiales bacterium]
MPRRTGEWGVALAALGAGLALSSPAALAQSEGASQRVEITGSALRRIGAETEVPVTVIRMADLAARGLTTVEQVMAEVVANQSSQGTSQAVGLQTGGASFADLRGLGQNKTLVLLNGRRIANNPIDGSAPDLNSIPLAALDRIEILRDGASALYGTDAIGGVVNFITRRDYRGATIAAEAAGPQHPGGGSSRLSAGFGHGDLDADGYNLFGFFDLQNQSELRAAQRPFAATGNIPALGISNLSYNAFPANYYNGDGSVFANPAGTNCAAAGMFSTDGGVSCSYDPGHEVDLIPQTRRFSGFLKGVRALDADTRAGFEYFVSRSVVGTGVAPAIYPGYPVDPGTAYFPGAGITPLPSAAQGSASFDPTQPIYVLYRDSPSGRRTDRAVNTVQRLVLDLKGSASGWDYDAAVALNQSRMDYALTSGFTNSNVVAAGLQDGTINPFGPQSAAGAALLASAAAAGPILEGRAQASQVDAHASRALGDWFGAGSPAQLALGAEWRAESLAYQVPAARRAFAAEVQNTSGIDPAIDSRGSRHVMAAYAELGLPLNRRLDLTLAVRGDKYSDFGSTLNPKLSFRFQPNHDLLLRGSVGTGFRAPSLYDLHAPQTYTNSTNPYNDPLNCPNGVGINGYATALVCGNHFMTLIGGNPALKAETSRSANLGMVFKPVADAKLGLNFWWIRLEDQINNLNQDYLFANPSQYAARFVRNPAGALSINGADCPGPNCGYVFDISQNLGGVRTSGVDLDADYRLRAGAAGVFRLGFAGTYVSSYRFQYDQGGPWFSNLGRYGDAVAYGGAILRWQHNLTLGWSRGDWSAGLAQHFKSGYEDQNSAARIAPDHLGHRVASISLWDVFGSVRLSPQWRLSAGIRNLFDTGPPASNQGSTFQQGFDPRYADPLGRTFYLSASWTL